MKILKLKRNNRASTNRQDPCRPSPLAWIGLLLLFAGGATLFAGEVDRLLVAVNGSVITEGDLQIARGFNALVLSGNGDSSAPRKEELDRRIDLELILQELKNLNIDPGDSSVVDAKARELQDQYAGVGGVSGLLEGLGLEESELMSFLRLEISIMKLVEFRFRPFVHVSPEDIEDYYKERLAPQLQRSGIELPPLESVSAEIEMILKEERINEELDRWIKDARRNARIEYFTGDNADIPGPGSSPEHLKTGTME